MSNAKNAVAKIAEMKRWPIQRIGHVLRRRRNRLSAKIDLLAGEPITGALKEIVEFDRALVRIAEQAFELAGKMGEL